MGKDPLHVASLAVKAANDKKAYDPIILDVQELTPVADYFVIVSGTSSVHLNAIAEAIIEDLDESGARLLHKEGSAEAGWILLDYGHTIVHVFRREEREFYDLERLWRGAKVVGLDI
ncbi:MAG TPA: ribosome silencing factor [Firmicutes bacterium]|nr:ribosome silencing factor [Bacillota bacterium]